MSDTDVTIEPEILRAATAFARALRASRQFEEFQTTRADFDADPGLQRLLLRLRELSAKWQAARAAGRGLVGKDATELAELQAKLQAAPLFVKQQDAIRSLVAMFQQVNQVVSTELELDFAANAAPQGGGCCG